MTDRAKAVLAEALKLDGEDRLALAAELSDSVHPPAESDQAAVDAAWQAEIRRRLADYYAGKVDAIDGDVFLEKVRSYRNTTSP
ncbi:MAG: addiction module protein [Planctomycetota bacterium]